MSNSGDLKKIPKTLLKHELLVFDELFSKHKCKGFNVC